MDKKLLLIIILGLVLIGGSVFAVTQISAVKTRVQSLIGRSAAQPPTPTAANTPVSPTPGLQESGNPKAVVQKFYQWYFACSRTGGCDYSQQAVLIDQQTVDRLTTAARGYNPIVCSQNVPDTFIIDRSAQNSENSSSVIVIMNYLNNPGRQLTVTVTKNNNDWKITNITCPS